MRPEPAIESLRAQIEKIEGRSRRANTVLPFGIADVDSRLPGGGFGLPPRGDPGSMLVDGVC